MSRLPNPAWAPGHAGATRWGLRKSGQWAVSGGSLAATLATLVAAHLSSHPGLVGWPCGVGSTDRTMAGIGRALVRRLSRNATWIHRSPHRPDNIDSPGPSRFTVECSITNNLHLPGIGGGSMALPRQTAGCTPPLHHGGVDVNMMVHPNLVIQTSIVPGQARQTDRWMVLGAAQADRKVSNQLPCSPWTPDVNSRWPSLAHAQVGPGRGRVPARPPWTMAAHLVIGETGTWPGSGPSHGQHRMMVRIQPVTQLLLRPHPR